MPVSFRLWENEPGVDEAAALTDFEVQVCALRVTGVAGRTNPLASIHALAWTHADHAQVSIYSGIAIAVVDLDNVAVSVVITALSHSDDA